MANTKKPTVRKASAVKMCLKCQKIKPLTEFYKNAAWTEQNGVDIYCKECVRDMCYDKETIRQYCWENGRAYSEPMWETAQKRSKRLLINNAEWLSDKTSKKRKEEIENKYICGQFFLVMGMAPFYSFRDPTDEDGNIRDFNPDSQDGMIVGTEDGDVMLDEGPKMYSATWNGMYTKREIEYLDGYYKRLEDEFVLDDVNIQDYSRKCAKSSLLADAKYNDYRAGKCSLKEWQDAQSAFDSMSKSAAFTAAQKKDKNSSSDAVLCKIIEDIEMHHQASITNKKFDPDDIDMILEDFAHTEFSIK